MGRWILPDGWDSALKAPQNGSLATCHDQNYTVSHIESYLKEVKHCIRKGSFIVLEGDPQDSTSTRYKNTAFMAKFRLWGKEQQQRLLLSVDPSEFCHVVRANDGRSLYVFCAQRNLHELGGRPRTVKIYIKHDFSPSGKPIDVVVSLHELEYPIQLAFEE